VASVEINRTVLALARQGSALGTVLNAHYEEDGATVFRAACKLGCEGIVSKRLGSIYRFGLRSKIQMRQR